jgi:hypothetical protein
MACSSPFPASPPPMLGSCLRHSNPGSKEISESSRRWSGSRLSAPRSSSRFSIAPTSISLPILATSSLLVHVKTSTHRIENDSWRVEISTRGGNQSWSGVVKYFDSSRCDFLFVHVGDGRRWLIPSQVIDCKSGLTLGGPKYSQFEVEPGRPLTANSGAVQSDSLGEYRSGQTGRPVKALAQPSQVRILPPPSRLPAKSGFRPSKYERKLGRSGQAVINQKRRVTIPQSAFLSAGLQPGDRVRARSDGPGRVILEQLELPAWARSDRAR